MSDRKKDQQQEMVGTVKTEKIFYTQYFYILLLNTQSIDTKD